MATTVYSVTQYTPTGATDHFETGSTANIWRHPTLAGVVIKSPTTEPQDPAHRHRFRTEVNILKVLGAHPRIVQYLGCLQSSEPSRDLLFVEAANGSVQQYLNVQGSSINDWLRLKWCKEAAEALYYCHTRKVLHCDLRPDNMLLNADLDLSLCDFGGSKSEEYDGGGLPDYGFFDPRSDSLAVTEATEIFGLGSIMYTIMVGHLPHGPSILKTAQERLHYAKKFERLGLEGNFPDTSDIRGGDIIRDCWTQNIISAKEAFKRHEELDDRLGEMSRFSKWTG